jgi:hypothetical protein
MPKDKLLLMFVLIMPQQYRNAAENQKCEKRGPFFQI